LWESSWTPTLRGKDLAQVGKKKKGKNCHVVMAGESTILYRGGKIKDIRFGRGRVVFVIGGERGEGRSSIEARSRYLAISKSNRRGKKKKRLADRIFIGRVFQLDVANAFRGGGEKEKSNIMLRGKVFWRGGG